MRKASTQSVGAGWGLVPSHPLLHSGVHPGQYNLNSSEVTCSALRIMGWNWQRQRQGSEPPGCIPCGMHPAGSSLAFAFATCQSGAFAALPFSGALMYEHIFSVVLSNGSLG